MKDLKAAGFDQQPDQERIVALDLEETIDVDLAGMRQPRMADNIVIRQAWPPPEHALDFGIVQDGPLW